MRHLILLLILTSAAALDQGGAEAAVARGWAALDASNTDHTKNVDAALAFTEALSYYAVAGDAETCRELQANVYWAKKRMDVADIQTYLAGKGEPAVALVDEMKRVADAPVAASEADAYFTRADAFAKAHPADHLKLAIRYFEVASRFPGTQAAMDAQQRSLDEQVQAKAPAAVKAGKAAAEKPAKADKPETELSAKALKKLGGKALYKDGVLTVVYDWSNAKQLEDWNLNGTKPTSEKGALRLAPADRIESKIRFVGEAKLSCDIAMENYHGDHVLGPNGLSVGTTNYNAWFIQVRSNGKRVVEGVFNRAYNKQGDRNEFLPMEWTFTGTKVALKFGTVNVAKEIPAAFAGGFTLTGGEGGNGFRTLTLSGKVDEAWAKEFFGLADAPADTVKKTEFTTPRRR